MRLRQPTAARRANLKTLPSSDAGRNSARTQWPYIRDTAPFGFIREARGQKRLVLPEVRDFHLKRKEEQAPKPVPPAIQNLLKKAYELKYQLAKTPGLTRFRLAREINMDPAQLTRFLNLTALAPKIQQHIYALPLTIHRSVITDRDWHRLGPN